MNIGGGIFLAAVGAILMFALNDTQVGPVNFYVIGLILIIAGIAIAALSAMQTRGARGPRAHDSVEVTRHSDGTETVKERRTDMS